METSLRVFCGNYISDEGAKEISDNYWLITVALELVNFPFAFPGTKVYNAIKARKTAMKWFELTARESKKRMAEGEEVTCLTDAWIKAMIDARLQKENATWRPRLVVFLCATFPTARSAWFCSVSSSPRRMPCLLVSLICSSTSPIAPRSCARFARSSTASVVTTSTPLSPTRRLSR